MAASDVAVGIIFLVQTVVGTLGNSSLLLHYLVLYFTGFKVRHTDLILQHLIVANLLTLLCKGVPQTMEAFGVKIFLSDFGCKLLFYLHRVGRGVSIGSTCLLSVFQAIKISPGDSCCSNLKVNIHKYIGSSIYLSWILYLFVNVVYLMYMTGRRSNKNITILKDFGYCSGVRHDATTDSLHAALLTFPDVLCVGLMLWASSSMVLILHRQKQRMQQVHKSSSPRSSPESRATKTILLLVSTFVSLYTLSCMFQVSLAVIYNANWFVVSTAAIISGCFPAVSPFLLMSRDSTASRIHSAWIQNRKNASHVRKIYIIYFCTICFRSLISTDLMIRQSHCKSATHAHTFA
ncbi:vomeronasal type-1 receptor 4-like [Ictidomys tridecemlineatus]|uniref:vomeronasal type-1 receptor 4-like n=1 Tax=Ictidomys tridecemlineatus TaxID=43179 RepID=UPI00038C5B01|nr:vomeronasal type-1 receptor 4-like [Ictidomys tridecemlineatus]KAG3255705.1 vomeronasal type-1 receptor 4-like [Ictidomys tridecemlineatus]